MTLCFFINYFCFSPILEASEVIIPYGLHPFDICSKNPDLWYFIKFSFLIFSAFSFFVFGFWFYGFWLKIWNSYFSQFFSKVSDSVHDGLFEDELCLIIGRNEDDRIYC